MPEQPTSTEIVNPPTQSWELPDKPIPMPKPQLESQLEPVTVEISEVRSVFEYEPPVRLEFSWVRHDGLWGLMIKGLPGDSERHEHLLKKQYKMFGMTHETEEQFLEHAKSNTVYLEDGYDLLMMNLNDLFRTEENRLLNLKDVNPPFEIKINNEGGFELPKGIKFFNPTTLNTAADSVFGHGVFYSINTADYYGILDTVTRSGLNLKEKSDLEYVLSKQGGVDKRMFFIVGHGANGQLGNRIGSYANLHNVLNYYDNGDYGSIVLISCKLPRLTHNPLTNSNLIYQEGEAESSLIPKNESKLIKAKNAA
ncbi:MAG TPA: hypothetical protein VGA67_04295 [Candidatus Dojkabacteria bacterium]|jgi:hypothetical protein